MGCTSGKLILSKEDLNFLLDRTHFNVETINTWFKKFSEECPDGCLTPPRFIALYKRLFPTEDAEDFCKHVFRTFDTDKNGHIDFKEFMFAIDTISTGNPEEKLRKAFHMYDVNGNGYISLEEMIKVMEAFCDMLGTSTTNPNVNKFTFKRSAKARAELIFRKLDTNKDGQVSESEFMEGCLQDEEFSQFLQLEQNLNKVILSLI